MTISGTSVGRLWFSLSIESVTSAICNGFRVSVPLKMTSCIEPALKVFVDCSPSTHLIESTIFDFPHPFGPNKDVMPSEKSICVLSGKLLNPFISSDFKNTRFSHKMNMFSLYKDKMIYGIRTIRI